MIRVEMWAQPRDELPEHMRGADDPDTGEWQEFADEYTLMTVEAIIDGEAYSMHAMTANPDVFGAGNPIGYLAHTFANWLDHEWGLV